MGPTRSGCWLGLLVFSLLVAVSIQQGANKPLSTSQPSCSPLDPKLVPFCAGMPYKKTLLPNSRGHATLQEAFAELKDFKRVILSHCSNAIVHFLCSVYTPPCYDTGSSGDLAVKVVQPCRQLCVEVHDKCEGFFQQHAYNLSLLKHLSCNHYPDRNDSASMCFGPADPSSLTIPKIESQLEVSTTEITPHFSVSPSPNPSTTQQCRNSLQEVPMCRELGYHNFSLPNLRGHHHRRLKNYHFSNYLWIEVFTIHSSFSLLLRSLPYASAESSQATQELSLFKLFVDMKCSQSIAHFLCYYYAPPCSTTDPCSRDLVYTLVEI